MKNLRGIILFLVSVFGPFLSVNGQSEQLILNPPPDASERTFTFENPKGSVKVTGYEGDAIVINANLRFPESPKKSMNGMNRIEQNPLDLQAEIKDQNVLLFCRTNGKTVDFDIKIPARFSLKLRSLDNGDVEIYNINGEIVVENNNGKIVLSNISGTAVLSSVYGNITASFLGVKPGSPMMFTSFEGDISVSLPANVDANLKMKSDKGEILSDFDIKPGSRKPVVRQVENTSVYSLEDWVTGSINKGGPEFIIKSYSGNITLKKK